MIICQSGITTLNHKSDISGAYLILIPDLPRADQKLQKTYSILIVTS